MTPRSGGHLLADQLVVQGVELAFCVPGESYLALLDGLFSHRDRLRVVTCRHEAAAANAADAYGKLTGRPGVCMVTRGPGATHASTGVHTAMQDSTPLVLLVGQVPREHRGREAFQEVDYEQMFGRLAKWVFEIDRAERIPELVARAFETALGGDRARSCSHCPRTCSSRRRTRPMRRLWHARLRGRRRRHSRAWASC